MWIRHRQLVPHACYKMQVEKQIKRHFPNGNDTFGFVLNIYLIHEFVQSSYTKDFEDFEKTKSLEDFQMCCDYAGAHQREEIGDKNEGNCVFQSYFLGVFDFDAEFVKVTCKVLQNQISQKHKID